MTIFEPNYLNLEFFFNLIYRFLLGILPFLLAIARYIAAAKPFLLILALGLGILVFVLIYRIANLRRDEMRDFLNAVRTDASDKNVRNDRWVKIMQVMDSDNPAEWKQAIMEADIMLDEMVRAMNYPGDNLGERLKAIEPSDFLTLQDAWEAHKVRTQIAHEGSFVLTRRE
ncbi:MAG: hypothetical protein AAB455_00775, partial [Patescibacteria group bacterium]